MLRRVVLVRSDVSEELRASIIRVMEGLSYSETSVLTRAARRDIPEDTILFNDVLPQFHSLKGWNAYLCY
jgi:hypothetical protein